jgi:hypothetical protein
MLQQLRFENVTPTIIPAPCFPGRTQRNFQEPCIIFAISPTKSLFNICGNRASAIYNLPGNTFAPLIRKKFIAIKPNQISKKKRVLIGLEIPKRITFDALGHLFYPLLKILELHNNLTCHLQPTTCNLPLATCNLPLATCNLPLATCYLQPATCNPYPHISSKINFSRSRSSSKSHSGMAMG